MRNENKRLKRKRSATGNVRSTSGNESAWNESGHNGSNKPTKRETTRERLKRRQTVKLKKPEGVLKSKDAITRAMIPEFGKMNAIMPVFSA